MYQIRLLKDAVRDLEKLDKEIARRILKKINRLVENAETVKPKGLRINLAGLAKLREGDYRIIYEIIHAEEIIIIHFIGNRSEVYKRKWKPIYAKNKVLAWLIMNTKFAVCINNKGFEASLEVGKLYEIVADAEAESDDMIRVIDEDGEDYLFEAKIFYPLVLPSDLAVALHERVWGNW